MNPTLSDINEEFSTLTFKLSNMPVSFPNAIRRVILSEIPCIVFKTTPYEENKSTFITNTSRLHNEIIKQRLSCIPIHINDINTPLEDYELVVNVKNTTDNIIYVTSKDFKIRNKTSNKFMSQQDTMKIFPPNELTGDYIIFVRLRPRINEQIQGEELHLTCGFSIGKAMDDGCYAVASTCAYSNTIDEAKRDTIWRQQKDRFAAKGLTESEIDFEYKDWLQLEAKRIFIPNSYNFIIETIGPFNNLELINMAIDIIINKTNLFMELINTHKLPIKASENTLQNSYDITLVNEDYTLGKMLEYILFNNYLLNEEILSFCAFKKFHPHDDDSIIRLAFKETVSEDMVLQYVFNSLDEINKIFATLKKMFNPE